ncbi:PAS/PAC sensor signal transduction histidine kinase [Sulfurifustis variabilis]|uniref:histidine kinase n=1 Tax=Sulfurifustis variabilis TaxID=1675686 RepID=A0A1B4VBS9_9GAMM|nr:PAS domain-containing sensor histidine kinase [Sulfurifustis variabilis]BAU50044.1 PAS/PAC sensor signal transduction histidine kinase [Sulfurifustis variabilis]
MKQPLGLPPDVQRAGAPAGALPLQHVGPPFPSLAVPLPQDLSSGRTEPQAHRHDREAVPFPRPEQREGDLERLPPVRPERTLRSDEAKYRLLAENMSDGFALQDEEGRLRDVNGALCRMLGYRRDELLGTIVYELLSRPCAADLRSRFAEGRYARGGRCEAEWLGREGRRIHTHMSLLPLPTDDEPSRGYCVIVTDVTERRQTERALRRSKCELRLLSAQLLAAQEMERKRIAYELHDRVGQSLSAIKFRVESGIAMIEGRLNSADLASFQAAVERIQSVVEDVRRIAMDLRPSTLDDLGILPTIAWFCREFRDVYRHIELDVDIAITEQQVPVGLKTAIYRVLQEALNNVAKHAGASRVWVNLKKAGERIEFTVRDDGCGLDPAPAACREGTARGLGLTSMQERVESSGGVLSVTSNGNRGTLLRAVWPWAGGAA